VVQMITTTLTNSELYF